MDKGLVKPATDSRGTGEPAPVVSNSEAPIKTELEREKGEPKPRFVTHAPEPITPVGRGWTPPRPKFTRIPPDFPSFYPNDLKPQTHVIIADAVRKFPEQTLALELCKYVISQLTPHFRTAVQRGAMRADLVLSDCGIQGLLRCLLVYNCDDDNKRYEMAHEARKSDEWLTLARVIADVAQEQSDIKSLTGQNIDRLRKECGWSFDMLANKTGIDKKLILSHVNKSKKPHPRTMRDYAQAFAKALNRQITAADLEK